MRNTQCFVDILGRACHGLYRVSLDETSEKVWWYDGSKIVFRSESSNKLLHAMQENPYITTEELSKEADIVVTAVKKQLRAMIEKGYIQRRDNDNSWHVFATSSI